MPKAVLESEFVEQLRTLRPDAATVAQFPAIAAEVWARRHGDTDVKLKQLTARLEEQKGLKSELLRAKLRGEVNQPTTPEQMPTSTMISTALPNNCRRYVPRVERSMHSYASRA